jgi:hypothetical protein
LNFGSVSEAATKDAAIIGEEMKIKKMKGASHQFGARSRAGDMAGEA